MAAEFARASIRKEYETKTMSDAVDYAKKDIQEIFSPFFRSDQVEVRKESGTGLGLAISKTLVDLHGGNIAVTSELNKGTEVVVTLPRTSSAPTVNDR